MKKRCVRFDILGLDVETCVPLAFLGVLLASKPVVDSFLRCPTGWFDEGFRDLVPEWACCKTHSSLLNGNRLDWLLITMGTGRVVLLLVHDSFHYSTAMPMLIWTVLLKHVASSHPPFLPPGFRKKNAVMVV